jgi:hypothetical protein
LAFTQHVDGDHGKQTENEILDRLFDRDDDDHDDDHGDNDNDDDVAEGAQVGYSVQTQSNPNSRIKLEISPDGMDSSTPYSSSPTQSRAKMELSINNNVDEKLTEIKPGSDSDEIIIIDVIRNQNQNQNEEENILFPSKSNDGNTRTKLHLLESHNKLHVTDCALDGESSDILGESEMDTGDDDGDGDGDGDGDDENNDQTDQNSPFIPHIVPNLKKPQAVSEINWTFNSKSNTPFSIQSTRNDFQSHFSSSLYQLHSHTTMRLAQKESNLPKNSTAFSAFCTEEGCSPRLFDDKPNKMPQLPSEMMEFAHFKHDGATNMICLVEETMLEVEQTVMDWL